MLNFLSFFLDIIVTSYNLYKYFLRFCLNCLDTAMDIKYNKSLHRSTQRAW